MCFDEKKDSIFGKFEQKDALVSECIGKNSMCVDEKECFLVPMNKKGALISECVRKNSIFDVYLVICMIFTPTLKPKWDMSSFKRQEKSSGVVGCIRASFLSAFI